MATPPATVDLDRYFARIGWRGDRAPDYATMAGILDAHMRSIPFENLDVLLGRRIRLDLPGLVAKLVDARRGGYCFEHATLLGAVLEQLGFDVQRHIARVTLERTREAAARTHMFLTVACDGRRLVLDPGFGTHAARVPVPLEEGVEAASGSEWHSLRREERWWILRARTTAHTIDAWASTLEVEPPIDFELGNHYTATHPDSGFVNRLTMRALTADGRVTVANREVTVWRNGRAERSTLADRGALRTLLTDHFGVDLPEVEGLRVPAIPEWR